ncbi:EamA family transporter RarD [Sphingomonas panni]|uniref:EamA family transporter RarD n=1 Tax=Sphingomonas panni TaxID=237612 RepID=UPI001F5B8B8A|nr:EamA family transporter RarD [Sphingomonas panni]
MDGEGADRRGLAFGVGAYALWGLLPLYFRLLGPIDAGEIVAQRVLWSALLVAILVVAVGRGRQLRAAFADRRALANLVASAGFIAINWLVYVWAVLHGEVLAASLAYFLNPLLNVLLGVVLLGERMNRTQGAAVALAGAGVALFAFGSSWVALGISLSLAISFALYGLIRKTVSVGALEGLMVETTLLAPVALGYLLFLSTKQPLAFDQGAGMAGLLILAGAVTTAPLLLFSAAARRLRLATMGMLQFLAPSIQFLLAIAVFGETLTPVRLGCFALIWAGLAVYVIGGRKPGRREAAPNRA